MDENNKNQQPEEFLDEEFRDAFGDGEDLKWAFDESDGAPKKDPPENSGETQEEEQTGRKGRPARKKG